MAANREVRGLSEESAKLAESAKPVDDTPEAHANLAAALSELEARPGVDCLQELADHERRWSGVPMASVESIILNLAREERKHAPAPKRTAIRRRPGGEGPPQVNVGAGSAIVEPVEPDGDANAPVEPTVTDVPRPDQPVSWPGGLPHPQHYGPTADAPPLWHSDPQAPRSTSGDPLPPRPSPTPRTP